MTSSSTFVNTCDAIITALQTVSGLDSTTIPDSRVHRYAPWNPEELLNDGNRHMAVWPIAEEAEAAEDMATGFQNRVQNYEILVWEQTLEEESQVGDKAGDQAWLELYEAALNKMYAAGSQNLGGSWKSWFQRGEFAPSPRGSIRWWRLVMQANTTIAFG